MLEIDFHLEGEVHGSIVLASLAIKNFDHIKEGGLCYQWPPREGPLYTWYMLCLPWTDNHDNCFLDYVDRAPQAGCVISSKLISMEHSFVYGTV